MFIEVNGTRLYVEIGGVGPPLILLHGNGESHALFDGVIKSLSDRYTVIAPDSRGHGLSSPAPLSYEKMADDIIALVQALNLSSPLLYGFSDGGIIGLLVAMKQPALLQKLIVSGINVSPRGLKRKYRRRLQAKYKKKKDPRIELMLTQPQIDFKDLERVTVPVIMTAGEYDLISLRHTKAICRRLPNAGLKIIKGENHAGYVEDNDKLIEILTRYI